jgi:hypothetical protein
MGLIAAVTPQRANQRIKNQWHDKNSGGDAKRIREHGLTLAKKKLTARRLTSHRGKRASIHRGRLGQRHLVAGALQGPVKDRRIEGLCGCR